MSEGHGVAAWKREAGTAKALSDPRYRERMIDLYGDLCENPGRMMSLAEKISAYNRNRKWQLFLDEFSPHPGLSLLDVGFHATEYSAVDNYLEKHYPFPEKLTALGIDATDRFRERYPKVRAVRYDGHVFPFNDKEFDVCWSNAVIEHVGNRSRQLLFLREVKRVARRAFITTPNRLFPVEVHTHTPLLHWLPKRAFDGYLDLVGKGWAARDYMNLLTIRKIRSLLAEAEIGDYYIYRNRLLAFTLDFVVVF